MLVFTCEPGRPKDSFAFLDAVLLTVHYPETDPATRSVSVPSKGDLRLSQDIQYTLNFINGHMGVVNDCSRTDLTKWPASSVTTTLVN